MNETACKTCGAPIFFVHTAKGKLEPLDAKKLHVVEYRDGELFGRHIVNAYTPHFGTCPNADQHRKPR